MNEPVLVVADDRNKIYDLPEFFACGMSGMDTRVLDGHELIPLPPASTLFFLPERSPIGFDPQTRNFRTLNQWHPVAAFVPPGYTQLFTAAYREKPRARMLPLFSYAPVAWYKGKLQVAAMRIDKRRVHDVRYMDMAKVSQGIRNFKNTKNRLIRHLQHCAMEYRCPNAINFFLKRYECPLPASPLCNARCLGCISFQPEDACVSSQHRIAFRPSSEEIAEVALAHIQQVRNPIVSFGQGCEGEPLLAAKIIGRAIELIRKATAKGTVHMNTNAGISPALEHLFGAGLDSIRVSLNSAQEKFYTRYYRPRGYSFNDVIASIRTAKRNKKFVSLNYLVMPGFTDDAEEFAALTRLVRATRIDMIQWRNLNFDPQYYFRALRVPRAERRLLGMANVIARLKKTFPDLRHGYFNVHVR